MKLCPKCGKLSHHNSYFGAYICEVCGHKEPFFKKVYVMPKSVKSITSSRYIRKKQPKS